jgi:hypothetical protein
MKHSESPATIGTVMRSMEPISPRLFDFTRTFQDSGILDLLKLMEGHRATLAKATKGIQEIFESRGVLGGITVDFRKDSEKLRSIMWPTAEIARTISSFQSVVNIGVVTRNLFEASRFTVLADSRLLECRTMFNALEKLRLTPLIADFKCVAGLYDSFLSRCETARQLPASILPIPAREYFLSSELSIEKVENPEEDISVYEQCASTREEIRLHVFTTIEEALTALDTQLLGLWHGAVQAVLSDNPDKVRHAITSLRELFTQVLHRLAPDAEIAAWSSDPNHYGEKRRPTRRARLLYILTELNHEPFTEFLDADVNSVLKLIGTFQAGTHNPIANLSMAQMRLLFRRAESTLCSLIEARSAIEPG